MELHEQEQNSRKSDAGGTWVGGRRGPQPGVGPSGQFCSRSGRGLSRRMWNKAAARPFLFEAHPGAPRPAAAPGAPARLHFASAGDIPDNALPPPWELCAQGPMCGPAPSNSEPHSSPLRPGAVSSAPDSWGSSSGEWALWRECLLGSEGLCSRPASPACKAPRMCLGPMTLLVNAARCVGVLGWP